MNGVVFDNEILDLIDRVARTFGDRPPRHFEIGQNVMWITGTTPSGDLQTQSGYKVEGAENGLVTLKHVEGNRPFVAPAELVVSY